VVVNFKILSSFCQAYWKFFAVLLTLEKYNQILNSQKISENHNSCSIRWTWINFFRKNESFLQSLAEVKTAGQND
jgi:hypothetical protein